MRSQIFSIFPKCVKYNRVALLTIPVYEYIVLAVTGVNDSDNRDIDEIYQ